MTAMSEPFVRARGLTRRYEGVLALDGADLNIFPGEVIGLVGKNGAGKSTLIRILGGVEQPDSGDIRIASAALPTPYTPHAANLLGLAFMHQELANVPAMTVAENVALGSRFPRRLGGLVDWSELSRKVRRVLDQLELVIQPEARVGELTVVQQRMVMIARALYLNARVLVLDEPSTSLSDAEIAHLHRVVRALRDEGRSIVYVSHRIKEIVGITDRIVVMQDGRVTLTRPTAGATEGEIVEAIAGGASAIAPWQKAARGEKGSVVLRVRDLGRRGVVDNVSFDLHAGEILGIAGLVGSGRTELVRLIFGADAATSGSVELAGNLVRLRNPRDAVRAGIVLLPEDRRYQGLILDMTVRENITLPSLEKHRVGRMPFVRRSSEARTVGSLVGQLGIRTPGIEQQLRRLSGGNQQKVVLAKWLTRQSRVLIFDEPTQGVDVHAKAEIFALIREGVAGDRAAIVISSDFAELVTLCDRIIVLREGGVVGSLQGDAISEAAIVRLAYAA
jgi:ABC-type sugar transport system ATPase subunit